MQMQHSVRAEAGLSLWMLSGSYLLQHELSKLQPGYTNIQAYTHQSPWEVEPASCLTRAWLCLPDTVAQLQINTPPKNSRKDPLDTQCTKVSHLLGPSAMLSCRSHLGVLAQATLNSNGQHHVHSSRPKTHHHLQQTPKGRPRRHVCAHPQC